MPLNRRVQKSALAERRRGAFESKIETARLATGTGEDAVEQRIGQQPQQLADHAHLPGNHGVAGSALNGAGETPGGLVGGIRKGIG
jgi:hypothetical protein